MFWQLVVAVERSVEAVLWWSWWRRWHQAWARYYHYRRRAEPPAPAATVPAPEAPRPLLETLWQRLEPLVPQGKRTGRPFAHSRRVVLEAIVYVMQTGTPWHALPAQFPSWKTVYSQYSQWRKSGVWDTIWAGLSQPSTTSQLQL